MAFVLALGMCVSLAACGGSSSASSAASVAASTAASVANSTSAKEGGHVFGYTCMDMTNPFHIAMRDAIQAAVEANGDTLIAIDGQQMQDKQNNVIEDLITQGIEVLF